MKTKIVAQRLSELEKKHGRLTPALVVSDAKDPRSPLHDNADFIWDRSKAAEQNWLDHARKIIASIRIEVKTSTHTYSTVNYVRDPHVPPSEQGYVSVARAIKDKKLSRDIIDLECKQVMARFERLRDLAAPLGQQAVIDALIADLESFMQKIAA